MPYLVIELPFLKVNGITLFPFIFIRDKKLLTDKSLLLHEHIHIRQQAELLVIPFYLIYILNYLLNRILYKDHDRSYRNIVFEREAYRNERDPGYLKNRRLWAWVHYFKIVR